MANRAISPGKWRALQRASTPQNVFAILAIDHQDALRRVLRPHDPMSLSDEELSDFKCEVIAALEADISGVLVDPVYAVVPLLERGLARQIGLLVELEKADYRMAPLPLDIEIRPGWSVERIRRLSADGVKLFFYYHPGDAPRVAAQDGALRQIIADCDLHDLPLYAEPIMYTPPDGAPHRAGAMDRTQVVVESARRVAALGADVLKLEFPANIDEQPDEAVWYDACSRLTEAVDVPWVLLSAGVDFDTYCRQVEAACEAGASGYLAGRAVWGDAGAIADRDARREWLETEGRMRAQRLGAIARQSAQPWTEKLHLQPLTPDWYETR